MDGSKKESFGVMKQIEATLVIKDSSLIPVLSVIRRVNDVFIGGTFAGRPVGEIRQLTTRFMMPLFGDSQ